MANIRRVLSGDENAWVEFRASGYPFKLRQQLREATNDEEILAIIIPYIEACSIPSNGTTLASIGKIEDLLDVEEVVVSDIIWKFYDFRAERLREPLTKNN